MRYSDGPIDHLQPGDCFAAVSLVMPDRVAGADLIDGAVRRLRAEAIRRAGATRQSPVWVTRHYAAEGRRRYAEIVDLGHGTPDPRLVKALDHPRSVLFVAWCVVTEANYHHGSPQ